MGAALAGRLIDLLGVLGLGLCNQAHVFEHGQRRVDDAGARRIFAAGHFLDRLDQLIAVARLVGDQLEQHQAQLAALEHPLAVAAAMAAPAAGALAEIEREATRSEAEAASAASGPAGPAIMFKSHLRLLLIGLRYI